MRNKRGLPPHFWKACSDPQSSNPLQVLSSAFRYNSLTVMASSSLPRHLLQTTSKALRSSHLPCTRTHKPISISSQCMRLASTNTKSKHPANFTPPTTEDLYELRERVQDFTRREIP